MTETKDSHMDKRKVILIILGILILLLIILTSTWAFYQIDNTDSSTKTTGSINLDCIKIEYVEEGSLSPDYAYPIKDDYAKEHIKPVKVRITNTCEANLEDVNYSLVLTTLKKDDNNITSDKIRLTSKRALNITPGSEPESYDEFLKPTYLDELSELSNEYSKEALESDILNREKDGVKVFDGYSIIDTKVIDENFIKNNSESVYEIQLWIDYYEGDKEVYNGSSHKSSYDNSTQNKTFVSALSVVANPYEKHSTNFLNIMNYLRSKDSEKHLSENLQGGMYRYQGVLEKDENGNITKDVENYICLGNDCSEDGDDLYRIIGLTPEGELKVIKKTTLSEALPWHNSNQLDVKWPDSDLYHNLNDNPDSFYNTLSDNLKAIIQEHKWIYGDTGYEGTVPEIYDAELLYLVESGAKNVNHMVKDATNQYTMQPYKWDKLKDIIDAPIGLMYTNDYVFASTETTKDDAKLASSWIYWLNNDSTPASSTHELLMTRHGCRLNDDGTCRYCARYIRGTQGKGFIGGVIFDSASSIRPVFYLSNEIELFGDGTIKDPFRIITKDSENNKIYGFAYTGDYQTFSVPEDGTYQIELWGASGGDFNNGSYSTIPNSAGRGAYTKGNIELTKDDKLYVYVGENFNDYDYAKIIFNGGGPGESTGGGATDVRLEKGEWNNFEGLKSRIMVAAGGGGGANLDSKKIIDDVNNQRGDGGTLNGIDAKWSYNSNFDYSGHGASQTSGGEPGTAFKLLVDPEKADSMTGIFGQGGFSQDARYSYVLYASSGGGGGYYGGGHGNHPGDSWTGGGGGSSYISGYPGCKAINKESTADNITHSDSPDHYSGKVFFDPIMIAGNDTMPNYNGGTMVGNTGHGYARITKIK